MIQTGIIENIQLYLVMKLAFESEKMIGCQLYLYFPMQFSILVSFAHKNSLIDPCELMSDYQLSFWLFVVDTSVKYSWAGGRWGYLGVDPQSSPSTILLAMFWYSDSSINHS